MGLQSPSNTSMSNGHSLRFFPLDIQCTCQLLAAIVYPIANIT